MSEPSTADTAGAWLGSPTTDAATAHGDPCEGHHEVRWNVRSDRTLDPDRERGHRVELIDNGAVGR